MNTMRQIMTALLLLLSIEGFGNAGPNQTYCFAYNNITITMAATGTGTWTALSTNPATTQINNPSSPTTTMVGFTSFGTYGFKWGTAPGDTVYVTIYPPLSTTLILRGSCLGHDTLVLTGAYAADSIIWELNHTQIAKTIAADSIYIPTTPGFYEAVSVSSHGCQNGPNAYDDSLNVVSCPMNAGPPQAICVNTTITTAASGTGTWHIQADPGSVTITNPSSPTTTITGFSVPGLYEFLWGSGGPGDTLYVTVPANPATPILHLFGSCVGSASLAIFNAPVLGDSIRWYEGGTLIQTTFAWDDSTLIPASAGVYTTQLVNSSGCVSHYSDTVTVSSCGCHLTGYTTHSYFSGAEFLGAVPNGGSGTYTYLWSQTSGGNNGSVMSVTNNGIYSVTVTDTTGCTVVLYDTVTNLSCSVHDSISYVNLGGSQYRFTGHSTGSSYPAYYWSVGDPSIGVSSAYAGPVLSWTYTLPAGNHYVLLYTRDSVTGCLNEDSITFITPCSYFLAHIVDSTISGAPYQMAEVAGGNGNYIYQWSDTVSGANISIMPVTHHTGTNCVTVTDIYSGCTAAACFSTAGCNITDSLSYQVAGGGALQVIASVSGATRPAYSWTSHGATITNTFGNSVFISTFGTQGQSVIVYCYVTDTATGCTHSDSIVIHIPSCPENLSLSYQNLGGTSYSFTAGDSSSAHISYSLEVNGNFLSYNNCACPTDTVTLNPGINHIAVYTYDSLSGCQSNDTLSVNVPSSGCNIILATDSIQDADCGFNDGSVQLSASGGTAPYSYKNGIGGSWQGNGYFYNLAAGTDTFYVRDTTGCIQTRVVTIGIYPISPSVSVSASSSVICPGQIDTFYASPSSGGTSPSYQWYHNGIAGGTNSPIYITSGLTTNDTIIQVVMSSSLSCASPSTTTGAIHITIGNLPPAVSITESQSAVCSGAVDTFRATPTNGGTSPSYQWYHNGIAGGTNSSVYVASGLTTNDTIIRVVMTSNLSCASPTTASSQIHLVVNPSPAAPTLSVSGPACSNDTLHLSGTSGASMIDWYLGGTLVSSSSQAYTVAGGNGVGSGANQLHYPSGIALDASGNLYVADGLNNRVQKFPVGSTSATNGVTVAGGNGGGTNLNQVYTPRGITVDASGNIYVGEEASNRVQKFPAGSTSATNGTIVAGGNGGGSGTNATSAPLGLHVDASGNLYVTDFNNNRVEEFPSGSTSATNGTTIAGEPTSGTTAYQLHGPTASCFDASGYLYVADYYNNRIQRFPPGSTLGSNAVTVAGGNGSGSALNQIVNPESVVVDASGNIYVSDQGNNRILKFPPTSTSATYGVVVAGGNGAGSAANQLNGPYNIILDAQNNIYVADLNNYRIQKWSATGVNTSYIPTSNGTYTANVVAANGCTSPMSNPITVGCADTVWPGDADANRRVDNNDLLTIGLGYNSTGPVRVVQGIVWQGDAAIDWANNFSIYAPLVNYNHADCNGDGVINADDTLAIVTNFGDTHSKTSEQPAAWRAAIPGLKLQFSQDTVANGDTLTTSIILGSASVPANNVYGLAFTFNYDTRVDTLGTFGFVSSWLGTAANSININHNFTTTGAVKAAITGIDHTQRSGNGQIATFRCIITTDNINGKNLSYYANAFYISDITAIDQYGDTIPLNAGIDTGYVAFTPNGIHDISQPVNLKIYPNPAKDQLMVTAGAGINEVSISDMLGQNVMVQKVNNKQSEIIDVSTLEVGVYIVHVSTISGEGTARLVISR